MNFNKLLEKGVKITFRKCTEFCERANKEGLEYTVLLKVKESQFKDWFENRRPKEYTQTLFEETLYVASSDNKRFKSWCIGCSLFAHSWAEEQRGFTIPERIESLEFDWCMVFDEDDNPVID